MVEPLNTKATEPCGGCGATHPQHRCIGCMHEFYPALVSASPSLPVVEGGEADKIVSRLRSRPGEAITRTERLMDEAATLITTQQQKIERLTKEHAASQAVIEVQRQKLDTNAGWEAASAAESRVLSLEETLRRISAIKYPSADTKYALRATIDYARDQARAALKVNGNG